MFGVGPGAKVLPVIWLPCVVQGFARNCLLSAKNPSVCNSPLAIKASASLLGESNRLPDFPSFRFRCPYLLQGKLFSRTSESSVPYDQNFIIVIIIQFR